MRTPCFALDVEAGIAHLRLVRPEKANSMIPEFWRDLPEIVGRLDAEAKTRVLVISAEGRHFSSGMDVAVFASGGLAGSPEVSETGRRREALRHHLRQLQETFSCLERARFPVIAAVQGACIGAGVDFVSACDLRYGEASAFFAIEEINIGMTADVGTFPRLQHLIPLGWVKELAYTGRRLPAVKAKEIGLLNEVFPTHEAMMDAVLSTAREIAARSPLAITGSKVMINYGREHGIDATLDYLTLWQTGMLQDTDLGESFAARAAGRAPLYEGLAPLRRAL